MKTHPRFVLPGLVSLLLAAAPVLALAQEGPEALLQRIKDLENQNRVLQQENAALKQKTEAPSAEPETPAAPTLKEAEPENADYLFLKLGAKKDYLKAERWRIIDQIEQAIPPLYEPVLPLHGYTLPPGAWRVGLGLTYGHNPGDFGRDKFYSLFFDHVKIDFLKVNLDVAYGFELGNIHDLTLQVNVPYSTQRTSGTGHAFRIDPMVMTMEGAARGLGDITVTLKKKWFDQANRSPVTFSTMLGLILPTGASNRQFNASQTVFMNGMAMPVSAFVPGNPLINIFGRTPGDRRFPDPGQPGHGSWGARFGFGATRQFQRSALHAGAIYDLLADNDGVRPGNELRYGVSYTLPPLSSDRLALDFAVFGLLKSDEHFPGLIMHPERDPASGMPIMDAGGNLVMFLTPRPAFKHGNILFFSPSVILVPRPGTRLTLTPALRVSEPNQGPSPKWTLSTAITTTF